MDDTTALTDRQVQRHVRLYDTKQSVTMSVY